MKKQTRKKSEFEITAATLRFMTYFSQLGPRWGLAADTCRIHALLYLAGTPLSREGIAKHARLTKKRTDVAIEDLLGWRVATESASGLSIVSGEPIDLMFSALEERGRREIQPALDMLRSCKTEAMEDKTTLSQSSEKISGMLQLVEDLAALDTQSRRITSKTLSRLVGFGGRTARLIDRAFPISRKRKKS